jgi:DNA-binding transcriptional LysR family regulator
MARSTKLRPGRVDLDALASFVAVADSSSFSVAAGRLGLPRSSVSRHIARLEADLGERLIHRSTRRVSLSVAGAALFERTRPLVLQLREALADLPERAGDAAGELRVTAPNDFGNYVLAGLLPALARRHPALRLDLRLTNRMVDLAAEGVDLAIRVIVGQPPDAALVVRRLVPTEVGVYAAATYLAQRGTPQTLEGTKEHDWVLFRSVRGGAPLPPGRVVAFADDFQFIHNAVAAGAGLGWLPGFLAAADLEAGRLVRLLPSESWSTEGRFCLVYPKTRQPSRKLVALRDFLLEAIGA